MKNNTTQKSDYELYLLVAQGDESAFSRICDRYLKIATNFVRGMMKESKVDFRVITEADIAQEAFVKIYFAIVNGTIVITESKSLGPVIMVITKNLFVDKFRHYTRELNRQRPERYLGEAENLHFRDMQKEQEDRDLCEAISVYAKQRLSPKKHRVFEHIMHYGSPYGDIAADLNLTPGATSSIVYQTRRVFLPLRDFVYSK